MPELANSVPPGVDEAAKSPAGAPTARGESIPIDVVDYVTPPPKKVLAVSVRYGAARKGEPLRYDLAGV